MSKRTADLPPVDYGRTTRNKLTKTNYDGLLSQDKFWGGANAQHETVEKHLQVQRGVADWGNQCTWVVQPSVMHVLDDMEFEFTMAGPIVGAGSANEAYADGIISTMDRYEIRAGNEVFFRQYDHEILAEHEIFHNLAEHQETEEEGGFGTLVARDAQLGAGYTYRVRNFRNPFKNSNFPLHLLKQPMEITMYFKGTAAAPIIELNAGAYTAGAAFTRADLILHGRNLPKHVVKEQQSSHGNGKEFEWTTLEAQRTTMQIANGANDYEEALHGVHGVHHLVYWFLRYTTDLTTPDRYNFNNFVNEANDWYLEIDQRRVTGEEDPETERQTGAYMRRKFGKIYQALANAVHVHAFTWSPFSPSQNHWSSHVYGSPLTISTAHTPVLHFHCDVPLTANCELQFNALDITFLYLKDGAVYRRHK